MKTQADKGRSEREFSVGTMVYLKLQPYIQTSVAQRSNQKLAFRFFGPFKILQRIGKVAYKLDLPADCRIHPVVHVSQLKLHIQSPDLVNTDLSSLSTELSSDLSPVAVLDHRLVSKGSTTSSQVLVRWSSSHPTLTTWESAHEMIQRFPDVSV